MPTIARKLIIFPSAGTSAATTASRNTTNQGSRRGSTQRLASTSGKASIEIGHRRG